MSQIFIDELKAAGIPTDEDSFKKQFEQQLVESGFVVNNQSPLSPFWRLQSALVAKPALQLIERMTSNIMPNSFAQLAHDEYLDLHGQSRGVKRLTEVKAQGQLRFYRSETELELVIPSGTLIESLPINGRVYMLELVSECRFNVGEETQSALAQAVEAGQAYNLAAGYYTKILANFENVTVTNDVGWLVTAGQDVETDENYRERIRAAFAQLGSYHVDFVYKNLIATHSGIPYDNIVLEKGAPRGAGTANAYVFLEIGQVSQSIINSINNYIAAGNHGLGDDLQAFAIPNKNIDLTVTIAQKNDTPSIISNVEQFIRAVFRQNDAFKPTRVKPLSSFSFSLLNAELHNTFSQLHSVEYDVNQLESGFWLPKLQNLVVKHG
ncbi:baseplate J/gp47 family protein [Pseudoalteromonas sp. S16_S37]|uniref:baseplate J/gp47 family protein n=1 Tax=Pseudoalteromonas sp. S16_S37 TaxID=2720228 RepID=UPI001680F2EF|nr:baseplate J/gp47 family protein [Pseudoalteromonas sp. S16_S37]MBD1582802.1 hypothetical protein [Pseudoalteromonas sp. S16_S37]